MFWKNDKINFEPVDAIMQKHFCQDDIDKIKSMDALYIGVQNSINTGIENTKSFILSLANECPGENCPVKNALCEECYEKPCKDKKEEK